MDKREASRLLNRYLANECTEEERVQIEHWYAGLQDEFEWSLGENRQEEAKLALKQRIDRELGWNVPPARIPLLKRTWVRYAAAAMVILAIGSYFFLTQTPPAPIPLVENIQPGGNKATLTLSNGETITLDQAAGGKIAQQGKSRINKLAGGQLEYIPGEDDHGGPLYNTLSTPKGGQYRLVLPDGSKVWLNAMSSIRYPVAFNGNERKVSIQGEVYFEVEKAAELPFHVSVNDNTEVEVLGTRFNITAYNDEPFIKTTLLQGKVKVSSENAVILAPGQQASLSSQPGKQSITMLKEVDTELAVAWLNGYFQFDQAGIQAVMQQIARWYDIEVHYEGKLPVRKFSGEISRTSSLTEVLKGLSATGINFKQEGRKIIVTQ